MNLRDIFRRFARNASIILGGRLFFGLVNLGTSGLVVRLYGLPEFGVVVLLQAYARLFTEIAKFESWQAVLSYGTIAYEKDRPALRRLLGLTLGVDICSALLGIAVGIALIPWAARIFDWPQEVVSFAPVFLVTIVFITQGTFNGVLRLTDRVDVLAWQHGCNALVRLAGVLVAWGLGAGVMGLVLAWFAGSVISGLLQFGMALRELARRGIAPRLRVGLLAASAEFPGIWRFLGFANLASSISFVYNSGAALAVGAEIGSAAAATLQIARQFANGLGRPFRLLGPIIAPEFALLAGAGNWRVFRKLLVKQLAVTSLLIGGIAVLLFPLLGPLLSLIYTEAILPDIWLFRLLIVAALISMISFSFEPALLATARAGTLLAIRAAAASVFIATGLLLIEPFGLIAVGVAYVLAQLVDLALFAVLGGRMLAKRVRAARPDLYKTAG